MRTWFELCDLVFQPSAHPCLAGKEDILHTAFHTVGAWHSSVLPDGGVLQFDDGAEMATYTKTWHWNCVSSLCTNNYRTKGITYYTLPSDPELQKGYRKVLMNANINWRKYVICSAHWSSGKRENKNQLPYIICTKEYAANLEKEYSQKPSRELKRKIDCTKTVLTSSNANTVRSTPRKPPKDRSETPVLRVTRRRVLAANVEKENQKLESQVKSLTRELNEKKALIEDLQQQLSKTQTELEKNAANNSQQLNTNNEESTRRPNF